MCSCLPRCLVNPSGADRDSIVEALSTSVRTLKLKPVKMKNYPRANLDPSHRTVVPCGQSAGSAKPLKDKRQPGGEAWKNHWNTAKTLSLALPKE
ncbi:hypothetical protein Y1Q_0014004 [Alligator mississippiensis]|uniref:Uncharacterized protein n=1 Tax=Alligator mississippiensis TaxID=8496 RepID=A0A151PDD2_ALLMI|nr:hypothetical protein Y1Q_0014004 [Alligator mississippiensis]